MKGLVETFRDLEDRYENKGWRISGFEVNEVDFEPLIIGQQNRLPPTRRETGTLSDYFRGGVLLEKLCGGVPPASQNPYPIYDQNMQLFVPYLRPDQIFDTFFTT